MDLKTLRVLIGGLLLLASMFVSAADSPHKFELGGLLQLDADWFGKFYDRAAVSDHDTEVRRARLRLNYKFKKQWRARISVQYRERGNDVDLHDAFVRYDGFDFAELSVGKFKQAFGMERMEGARNLSAMERAMSSDLLTPGRAIGVQLAKRKKDYTWAAGLFQEHDDDDRYLRTPPQSATARFSYAPRHKKSRTLHLGVSGSYRDWNENAFSLRSRGEVDAADNIVRSAQFIADQQWLLGLEAAWQNGPLLIQSEYMVSQVEAATFDQSFDYNGYYLQGSYLLTGERKKYSKGEFKGVKPKAGLGAFELVARYSAIDLRDHGLGAQSSVSLLGLNYHWRRNVKIMLNLLHPEIKGDVVHEQTDGDAVTLRLQFSL